MAVLDHEGISIIVETCAKPVGGTTEGRLFPSTVGRIETLNPEGIAATRACLLGLSEASILLASGSSFSEVGVECQDLSRAATVANGLGNSACDFCDLKRRLNRCPLAMIRDIEKEEGLEEANKAFASLVGVEVATREKRKGSDVMSSVARRATFSEGITTVDDVLDDDPEADAELFAHLSPWATRYSMYQLLPPSTVRASRKSPGPDQQLLPGIKISRMPVRIIS